MKKLFGAFLILVLVASGFANVQPIKVQALADTTIPLSNREVVEASTNGSSFRIDINGSLWAWGGNYDGQLGDGTKIEKLAPIKVMNNVIGVSTGDFHTLAIKTDGSLWAFGYNGNGQLGDGTNTDTSIPIKVMDNVVSVSAGDFNTLAIKTDGSLWAWGYNGYGQLGDGSTTETSVPIKVMDNVVSVSAGTEHTLAIKTDGSLWAWGGNYNGQLGDGTSIDKYTPFKVMDNVVSVIAGAYVTLAIKTDGSLWAWGYNGYGQLGDGTTTDNSTPIKLMDNVVSVSAGVFYTLAIKTDSSLWAWGANDYGQLGDGSTTYTTIPIKVMDNVVRASAGSGHSLAIRTDGSLWAWGSNSNGRLGDGTTTNKSTPIKVMDKIAFLLSVPSNLTVSTPTATSATLSWTSVSGANGYQVYRSLSATGTYSWIANAWTNSYTNNGLTTGTTYYYKIKAMNTTKVPTVYSLYSSTVAATPVAPLGIPSNLSVSTPTATSATLSWTNVSGANGYQVYRSLSATGTYSWIANAWTNSYTNNGLTTGTTYYYKVKAMNTAKAPTVYSLYGSTVVATPVTPLGIPSNLSASAPTATSATLSWTSVSGANGYQVYRSSSATGTYSWIANAWTNSYTNTGLTTGTTYYYKINAMNTATSPITYSAYSNTIATTPVTTLGIPTNPSVSAPTATSATLSWTSVSGANGYQVYRSNSATGTYSWIANVWTNSYTNTGLTTGTTYYYKIKAMNSGTSPITYSTYSSTVAATAVAPLGIPTNLSASTPSATSTTLSWTSVSGANGYQVYRSDSATGTYSWIANAWTNSYTNIELTTGTTYYYKIKAMNSGTSPISYSAYSDYVSRISGIPFQ